MVSKRVVASHRSWLGIARVLTNIVVLVSLTPAAEPVLGWQSSAVESWPSNPGAGSPVEGQATSWADRDGLDDPSGVTRWASLEDLGWGRPLETSAGADVRASFDAANNWGRRLESIPVSLGTTWMPASDSTLSTYQVGLKFPWLIGELLPPPILKVGFAHTMLDGLGPEANRDLFEYSVGGTYVRPINDRWTWRLLLGVALATDHENTSSDAWQFRGGAFGVFRSSERWQWVCGAIALGRSDLPVVPALGAVWTPTPHSRWDLIPPNPRANFLVRQNDRFHDWLYVGGGFNGSTWGMTTPTWGDDRLTYRDLRLAIGWQRTPPAPPGQPFARGRKYNVELAYAFAREWEFERRQQSVGLGDSWVLRLETEY